MKKISSIKNAEWEKGDLSSKVIQLGGLTVGVGNWSWTKNARCKYVNIRIDMRDFAYIFMDRDGNRITFEDVKRQGKKTNEQD